MSNIVKSTQETTTIVEEITAVEEPKQPFERLRAQMAAIMKREGVTGYILRNETAALIDIKDSTKLHEYALLSSTALETSMTYSQILDLGSIEKVLVNGKTAKILCMVQDENKINVFMEKDADDAKVSKILSK